MADNVLQIGARTYSVQLDSIVTNKLLVLA